MIAPDIIKQLKESSIVNATELINTYVDQEEISTPTNVLNHLFPELSQF